MVQVAMKKKEEMWATPLFRVFGETVQFLVLLPVNGSGIKNHKGEITVFREGRKVASTTVVWLKGSCVNDIKGFFEITEKCKIGLAKVKIPVENLGSVTYTGESIVDGVSSGIFTIACFMP